MQSNFIPDFSCINACAPLGIIASASGAFDSMDITQVRSGNVLALTPHGDGCFVQPMLSTAKLAEVTAGEEEISGSAPFLYRLTVDEIASLAEGIPIEVRENGGATVRGRGTIRQIFGTSPAVRGANNAIKTGAGEIDVHAQASLSSVAADDDLFSLHPNAAAFQGVYIAQGVTAYLRRAPWMKVLGVVGEATTTVNLQVTQVTNLYC